MAATAAAANTNPMTLAAVANLPTWADVFGTSGSRLVEYEIDDGAGHYECGYGTINLATSTLSRDYPTATFDSSAAPKYNGSNPVRLASFGAAVTVRCAPQAASVGGHENFSAGVGLGNGYLQAQTNVANSTTLQGWRNFMAFLWTGSRPIKAASINVRTAGTSGKLRVGLMEIGASGKLTLLREFTENSQFDLTLSGPQTLSDFAPLWVPPGPYVLQFAPYNTGGTINLTAAPVNFADRCGMFGRTSDGRVNNNLLSSPGATTLTTSLDISSGIVTNYEQAPLFFLGMGQ